MKCQGQRNCRQFQEEVRNEDRINVKKDGKMNVWNGMKEDILSGQDLSPYN